jgi:mannose-6-phosphate isomerase
MSQVNVTAPLTFEPIFLERIWGGRRLESLFGKKLPRQRRIGESWEIVDRPEAQSVVAAGPARGKTLHELWTRHRDEVFGASLPESERFPLLLKLLDAEDKLSLQVHPPPQIAGQLGGESKTEFWYVARAEPEAELFVGLMKAITRDAFQRALDAGAAADLVHTIHVRAGDAMFLPSGRFHAVGAGNLLVEIQQNSDTTYRVFDWNRIDDTGQPRKLHIAEALQSIDFNDVQPELVRPQGELLVRHNSFEIQKWQLEGPRQISAPGQFAIACCLEGAVGCAGVEIKPGEFFLVPAALTERTLEPLQSGTTLLRVTIPAQT